MKALVFLLKLYCLTFCFYLFRLGLYREAEKQFRSALNQQEVVDTYLYLTKVVTKLWLLFLVTLSMFKKSLNAKSWLFYFFKVYQRMDQPITALNLFKEGLDHFPGEVTLLTGIARIHEVYLST